VRQVEIGALRSGDLVSQDTVRDRSLVPRIVGKACFVCSTHRLYGLVQGGLHGPGLATQQLGSVANAESKIEARKNNLATPRWQTKDQGKPPIFDVLEGLGR
jgi:hypothetical protein